MKLNPSKKNNHNIECSKSKSINKSKNKSKNIDRNKN